LIRGIRDAFPLPTDIKEKLLNVDPKILEPIFDAIVANPVLCWKFKQRGLWVHGVDSLMDYLRIMPQYDVLPLADRIQCPTLLTAAESDPVSDYSQDRYDALACPKVLIRFADAEAPVIIARPATTNSS
jgi:alpha-beta hydrolase superfamily lysophospholipase